MANAKDCDATQLKPDPKSGWTKRAKVSGHRSSFLLSDATESYVVDQERMLAEIRQADRQVKSGRYVAHQDMKAWLLSWGTSRELPPPTCACGKQHHDESLCR